MEFNPHVNKTGSNKPLLKEDILYAQKNTNSHAQAARFLDVSAEKYRRFAKMYDLWEGHFNQAGKNHTRITLYNSRTHLRDILEGNKPNYDPILLFHRLLSVGILKSECEMCGFHEVRPGGKGPFMMLYRDGNKRNFLLSNLMVYCYNCTFITTGKMKVADADTPPPTMAPEVYNRDLDMVLSEEEIENIQRELLATQTDNSRDA